MRLSALTGLELTNPFAITNSVKQLLQRVFKCGVCFSSVSFVLLFCLSLLLLKVFTYPFNKRSFPFLRAPCRFALFPSYLALLGSSSRKFVHHCSSLLVLVRVIASRPSLKSGRSESWANPPDIIKCYYNIQTTLNKFRKRETADKAVQLLMKKSYIVFEKSHAIHVIVE